MSVIAKIRDTFQLALIIEAEKWRLVIISLVFDVLCIFL